MTQRNWSPWVHQKATSQGRETLVPQLLSTRNQGLHKCLLLSLLQETNKEEEAALNPNPQIHEEDILL